MVPHILTLAREIRLPIAFQPKSLLILVDTKRPVGYYKNCADFRTAMHLKGDLDEVKNDACMYVMERVWPVPPPLMDIVREAFFPEAFKDNEQSFVSRLYLGKQCAKTRRFFNPLNFPLDVKRLAALNVPVSTAKIAHDMGAMLARIHFSARNDGRDIEFVQGGDAFNPLAVPAFYCFDFNQVRP
ncbi:hypothetical protein KFL_011630010 [Klebsormidium nitens]|uniref:DUF3669 domain-containing protein n=1 Tax=Klebsormidium nitens TaxID=105231 RepID=A0A1Y1ITF2_KLENI|nr:hypothetical protein KFL_011630010 [Klebsormidium nitens]|eukprot:GAQ92839.1 hypothetical protein KFL_011630010 [Klebsormidium nitens]